MGRFTASTLIIALIAHMFIAGQGGGLVLCVGADGHMRLEGPASWCCQVEAGSAGRLPSVQSSQPAYAAFNACPACIDIPFLDHWGKRAFIQLGAATPICSGPLPTVLRPDPPRLGFTFVPAAVALGRLHPLVLRC